MGDKSSEEQAQSNHAENECEFEEIDIVSDPVEDKTPKIQQSRLDSRTTGKHRINGKSIPVKTSANNKKVCVSNIEEEAGPSGGQINLKNETKLTCTKSLQKVQFTDEDEGIPDETDAYKRFYFESDHLALKDNADYRLLLQTLVALEAQREQAVKDYEKLISLRKEALAEPVKFVEKLQNNEPLDIPSRLSVIKVPQINWEAYSGAIDDFSQLGLMHQHNTRHSTGTTINLERANQRWEEQSTTSNGSNGEYSLETVRFPLSSDSTRIVRGKLATSDKPLTFNQPWTMEEQRKLERLLQVFPQEPVEAKRWSKIANALGNRTPKQVASRVQKYFIKLAKSGLPIPGREPNLTRVLPKQLPRARNTQQQAVKFHNSTFFPSYKPRVYMEENNEKLDDLADISDDETIPKELRDTKEYLEILQLKRLKRKRSEQELSSRDTVEHIGYMCDLCGMNPITGVRWHCVDCPSERSTDFCSSCLHSEKDYGVHRSSHKMEPVDWTESDFVDGDYVNLGETPKGYNYLDPNFLPAAT